MLRSYFGGSTFIWNARGLPNSAIKTECRMTRIELAPRVDLLRAPPRALMRAAHGGQGKPSGGHAGEVLHQPRGAGRLGHDFALLAAQGAHSAKALDVIHGDVLPVLNRRHVPSTTFQRGASF